MDSAEDEQAQELLPTSARERSRKAVTWVSLALAVAAALLLVNGSTPSSQLSMPQNSVLNLDEEDASCHTIHENETGPCLFAIRGTQKMQRKHPSWYRDLDPETATFEDWQTYAWKTSHPKCPNPCSVKVDTTWCSSKGLPVLWQANSSHGEVEVRALSYNLFWWNLFGIRGGYGAAHLLRHQVQRRHFDFMGFQECTDGEKVLRLAGLEENYTLVQDETLKDLCSAYWNSTWKLLSKGMVTVAEDMRTNYYGKRAVLWLRLQHRFTETTVFFMNHHGPLSINSGGLCGGDATASNILHVISNHAEKGDAVILLGDFNANAASRTIQALQRHLLHVFSGPSFGGVDNIFSNVERSQIVRRGDLGSGGSDHHAISVVLKLGHTDSSPTSFGENQAPLERLANAKGADGCLMEPGVQYRYTMGSSHWHHAIPKVWNPESCCKLCQWHHTMCKSWTWTQWSTQAKNPLCVLHAGMPDATLKQYGFVSGLPKNSAIERTKIQLGLV
eukprot:TRINITY_DN61209_c0_g1_i1.p1 TRINITY_DN61209_c0_g1~~TRINITY_DN61209_c0_g1_i1.p1  ORF type:complete len:502 (-),score=54.89 TRINITY_DN61209_c0_g1_i1:188-1693(-)